MATGLGGGGLIGRERAKGGQGEGDGKTISGVTTLMTIRGSSCRAIKVNGGLPLESARRPTTTGEVRRMSGGPRIVGLMLCAAAKAGQAVRFGGGETATASGGRSRYGGGVTITAMSAGGGATMPYCRSGRGPALRGRAAVDLA